MSDVEKVVATLIVFFAVGFFVGGLGGTNTRCRTDS